MSITRIFRRRLELIKNQLSNEKTAIAENPMLSALDQGAFDARSVFIEHYPVIRKALEAHRGLGALIIAFDGQKTPVGQAWLKGSLDKTRAATIGRHSMCSLILPPEQTEISLRHLVVMVRAISHTELRVRVVDLHTPTAFRDEAGRVLQAVSTEGPCFVRVGSVILMVLITEEDGPIPTNAEDAYACIPDRVFIEERSGTAGAPDRRPALPKGVGATLIRSRSGPVAAAGDLCKSDERAVGTLVVRAGGSATRRRVGGSNLERGILIGRYARCDVGATYDEDSRLSRVHLLITKEGKDVLAVDTASSNGTFEGERTVLLSAMGEGIVYDLAGELEIAWHEES